MAAHRAMSRLGPGELTLAHIAEEAGLTAGALVQRFGSKRDLMLQLSEKFSGRHRRDVRRAAARPSVAAGGAARLLGLHGRHGRYARIASCAASQYLQIDLTDPEFRKHLARQARATRQELQKLIREAIEAKELVRSANPKQLARTIEAVVSGSMLSWAFYQEGTSSKWMRDDLNAILKPYLR